MLTPEKVNHPQHYGGEDNPYEAIKVIEAWDLGFNLGNTVKYIARCGKKDEAVQELQKARWYLDREIYNLSVPHKLTGVVGVLQQSENTLEDYQGFVVENKLESITQLPQHVQLLYGSAEIAGEAGEISEKVKKIFRDKNGVVDEEDRQLLKKELGDVLWGIASVCDVLNLSLQDVLELNVQKIKKRKQNNTIQGSGDNR